MESYFASPERTSREDLDDEIRRVSDSAVMSGILNSMSGLLAVLDDNRQIVALNGRFMEMLGIDDPGNALGLRLGEVLQCVHANDEPAGCGTTRFCSTCGAAVAMVASQENDMPSERMCALTARRDGKTVDVALMVKSQPVLVDERKFLLILAQDISVEQRRAALERVFFHDIHNMLFGLIQAGELLEEDHPSDITQIVVDTTHRLCQEVAIQQTLSREEAGDYHPTWCRCSIRQIVCELERCFETHPAAKYKRLQFSQDLPETEIVTDFSALMRILSNMIINALEATPLNGEVRFYLKEDKEHAVFCVWNASVIPKDIAPRIFQRNFSTKAEAGRGVGTFSMKLFGEDILGGTVDFSSSEGEGTEFRMAHPLPSGEDIR